MITPDEIIKSKRKTISICVLKDGRVVVRAPIKAKNDAIKKFILEKQKWIAEKLYLVNKNRAEYIDVINNNKKLMLGREMVVKRENVKTISANLDTCEIVVPANIPDNDVEKRLKTWYKKIAKDILSKRTMEYSSKIKIYPSKIKLSSSKNRWGSCTNHNVISFNTKVVMLPTQLIDYIIVHELCHIVEFNHSKKFWELVNVFLSNVKERRTKLKEYSFLLTM